MLKTLFKEFIISIVLFLKKAPGLRSIGIITGQVKYYHYIAATGETVVKIFPRKMFFNTITSDFKYQVAKWLGASNTSDFINLSGSDGISLYDGTLKGTITTTKDSGGTGAENWVKFKGVKTETSGNTYTAAYLGKWTTPDYATQTISVTLAVDDVFTIYWTITVN